MFSNQSSVWSNVSGNSTSCEPAIGSAHTFFIVIYSLLFLVGLVLNGFTLKVYFWRAAPACSSVSVYLQNLAAADFLLSLCLPLRILNYGSGRVLVRQLYCHFGAAAFYLNMYASILFMGYIAANRYLKIVRPLRSHILQRVKPARIISALTWCTLLSVILSRSNPDFLGSHPDLLGSHPSLFLCRYLKIVRPLRSHILQRVKPARIISALTWCSLLSVTGSYVLLSLLTQDTPESLSTMVSCDSLHSPQLRLLYRVTHICSAAVFLVVLVSLVVFYHSTSRRLAQAQRNQPSSSSSRSLSKSRRNMLVLVSVFTVCFVPYHLVRVPYAFQKNWWCWSRWLFYLKEVTIVLSALNVCLDPLIYFIFCKAFRAQMRIKRSFSTTLAQTQNVTLDRRSSDCRPNSIRSLRRPSRPAEIL
ncbi:P2Y purinoceptor 14-like [Menidia menidia]